MAALLQIDIGQGQDQRVMSRSPLERRFEERHRLGALPDVLEDGREAQNSSTVGAWKWHENHEIHRVLNPSKVRHTNVLIELKDRD